MHKNECKHLESTVVDVRKYIYCKHHTKWRRRKCVACGYRWSTREIEEEWLEDLIKLSRRPDTVTTKLRLILNDIYEGKI